MTSWRPGMIINATRLMDGIDPTIYDDSNFTVASGFSLIYFSARKSGKVVDLRIDVQRTGAAISSTTSGNIADTTVGTLTNSDLFPSEIVEGVASDGFGDGDFNVNTAGLVNVRTWSPNGSINATPNPGIPTLRLHAIWTLD